MVPVSEGRCKVRSRGRGRLSILKDLKFYLDMSDQAFNCDGVGGERVVETDFYALDLELDKLALLDVESIALQDRVTALRLVVHDLKSRSSRPTHYVNGKLRNWLDSWVRPKLAELIRKETKS